MFGKTCFIKNLSKVRVASPAKMDTVSKVQTKNFIFWDLKKITMTALIKYAHRDTLIRSNLNPVSGQVNCVFKA